MSSKDSAAKKLAAFDWNSPKVVAFDWGLAFASIGYGLWSNDPLWIGLGVLGLVLAWTRPMAKLQDALKRKFVKRR